MAHAHDNRYVTDEDRRELLKVLGVAGAVTVGGATVGEIREEMGGGTATAELAPIGEAIKADLAGQIDAGLIATQQAELATAANGLSVALERGLPTEAPRAEFGAVAEAGQPVYDHLGEIGFFESTTSHLPEFTPQYLSKAVGAFVGSEALEGTLEGIEFIGAGTVDVLATVIGNAQQLSDHHWVATDEIAREHIEIGELIPPMTMGAAGGALLWLEDLDGHLWRHSAILTENILESAVWHGQSMAAGFHLMNEGAKAIANEDASLSDGELGALLSTGFAVQAIGQGLLPLDVYWITDEMRGEPNHELATITE